MPSKHTRRDAIFHPHTIVEIQCATIGNLAECDSDTGWRTRGDNIQNIRCRFIARGCCFFQSVEAFGKRRMCETFRNDFAGFGGRLKIGILSTGQSPIKVSFCNEVIAKVVKIAGGHCMGRDAALQAIAPANSVAGERKIIAEIIMEMRQEGASTDIREEADAGFGHRKKRVFGHDPVRTMYGNASAATHDNAVKQRDIWLWESPDAGIQSIFIAEKIKSGCAFASGLIGCNHVATGAERPAFAFQNNTGDIRIGFPGLQSTVESENHFMRQSIERR